MDNSILKADYTIRNEYCHLRKRNIWVAMYCGQWIGNFEPKSFESAKHICILHQMSKGVNHD